MIKYFFRIIIAFLFTTNIYSQSIVNVDYIFYLDTELPKKVPCKLHVEKDSSIFYIDMTKFQKWDDKKATIDETLFEDTQSLLDIKHHNKFIKINRLEKRMEMIDNLIFSNNLYIIDTYPTNYWAITKKEKQIGKYKCIKATTNYRGRDWEVWFTTDLPYSFGPWKLQGLPGLILEAQSTDKRFTFIANKIDFTPQVLIFPNGGLKKITMQELIESYEETLRSGSEERDTTVTISKRNSPELIYEWEENK